MTQITRKSVPIRGLILLLAMFLGAGLVLSGCGDDDTATTPAPTPTPTPTPPAPEPEPEPPATPTGLMVSATTETSITWTWNAVEGALTYLVQVSMDETFDDTDSAPVPIAETSFTATDLAAETSLYARVRAGAGTLEAPLLSAWTEPAVMGTSAMTPPPPAPATPTGLMASETTQNSITWTWDAAEGAIAYLVQISDDEMFDAAMTDDATDQLAIVVAPMTSYTATDLEPETTRYARVAAGSGTLEAPILSAWTTHSTGTSGMPPPPPPPPQAPATPTGFMSETTEMSITWTWEAVDGATGYEVQVRADEMFTNDVPADEVTSTTETMHMVEVEHSTTRYARVRSTGGTEEEPLMSAWTTHMTATSTTTPPPVAPATPTGLMAEVTETSITWSWDVVEAAVWGYHVQVSADEMFTDPDVRYTGLDGTGAAGTTHTVEVEPSTTRYARVRSQAPGPGPEPEPGADEERMSLYSAWTTHVTATSTAAPPPTPDPVMVTFSLSDDAKDPHFLIAGPGTDEKTAMATVNPAITVMSNTDARITLMSMEDAGALAVTGGADSWPFLNVDWNLLQSDVLESGATFMIQRVTIGANQTAEPTGDVAYVTCGPFACADGMDAPDITIADSSVCEAWAPELKLEVGLVDNDASDVLLVDGYDLGWVSDSSGQFDTTHSLGTFSSVSVPNASKGTDKAIPMKGLADVISVDAAGGNLLACEIDELYADQAAVSTRGLDKPRECFRLHTDKDYLSEYEVTLTLDNGGVSWGSVVWENDPFEDLSCESVTRKATDLIEEIDADVCELFTKDVDALHTKDLKILPVVVGEKLAGVDIVSTTAVARRYTTMWYHDGAKKLGVADLQDLYLDPVGVDSGVRVLVYRQRYAAAIPPGWRIFTNHDVFDADTFGTGFVPLLDDDSDPMYGDLGKVDQVDVGYGGDDKADNFADDDAEDCSADDGGKNKSGRTETDGTLCDAEDVEIPFDIAFTDNSGPRGDHACQEIRSYTMTCTWDADGGLGLSRGEDTPVVGLVNVDEEEGHVSAQHFIECEIEEN